MEKFILELFENTFIMSLIIVVLYLLTAVFSEKFSAKWRYYVWLIVVIGLIIPVRHEMESAAFNISHIFDVFRDSQNGANNVVGALKNPNIVSATSATSNSLSMLTVVTIIWLIGIVVSIAYLWLKHRRFNKMVNRWSQSVEDAEIVEMLLKVQNTLDISAKITLKTCSCITTPMLIGLIQPVILLPNYKIPEDELQFIFKHELTHFKRKDLWFRCLTLAAVIINWFNPFVYLMARIINTECEASCDELVLKDCESKHRRLYGETIIGLAKKQSKVKTSLSTQFYGGKHAIKKRLFSILDTSKKKKWLASLCLLLIFMATIGSGAFLVNASQRAITADTAKSIALTRTNGGQIETLELDQTAGKNVYEIEVVNGTKKYKMDVDGSTGAVMNFMEKSTPIESVPFIDEQNTVQGIDTTGAQDDATITPDAAPNATDQPTQSNGGKIPPPSSNNDLDDDNDSDDDNDDSDDQDEAADDDFDDEDR